jgi:hypothetical protein
MDILTASDQPHSPYSRRQELASEPGSESRAAAIDIPNRPRIAAFRISAFLGKLKTVLVLPVSFAIGLGV